MGLDAVMAVALKQDANIEEMNARYKETHCLEDSLFPIDQNLIEGKTIYDNIEYINTYDVNTYCSRYYGIGYERGYLPRIINQLEWLRAQPETIEVYYGQDCGDGPSLWSKDDSIELLFHWFRQGNTPYSKWAIGTWSKA